MKRYLELVFEEDMKTAYRGGEVIRFTKTERLLLETFTLAPGRVLTRDVLLDAISGTGSSRSDRNIDYVVNRLRAKLGDTVKSPRFVATRYGEGYVWLARPEDADLGDVFLVIGPIHGLEGEVYAASVMKLIQRFRLSLSRRLSDGRNVSISTRFEPGPQSSNVEYALELGFLQDGREVHGRAILRSARTWQTVKTCKLVIDWPLAGKLDVSMADLAAEVIEEIVLHKAETGTQRSMIPLELSLHEASRLLAMPDKAWLESGGMLARKRAENPGDVKLDVMWASHLYATLVMSFVPGGMDPEIRAQTERQIESICLGSLTAAQDNPVLLLCIAKLLFFVDRRYLELAESLVRDALQSGEIGFTAVYPLLGQLHAARGQFDEALRLYDHAWRAAEAGSKFQIFIAMSRLSLFLAADQREVLKREAEALSRLAPETIHTVGIFLGRAEDPFPPILDDYLSERGPDEALDMVRYLYNTSARHFVSPVHRERIYRGFAAQIERKFGLRFVPPEP